jgi:ABC-type sugar transport system substrate-binding protein
MLAILFCLGFGSACATTTETTAAETTAAETTAAETTAAETTAAGELVIGYVLPWGPVNPAIKAFTDTVSIWCEKEGVQLLKVVVGEDVEKQANAVRDFIAEGKVNGMVLIPVESDAMTSSVEELNEANILVGCMDRVVSGGNVVGTVTAENYQAAVMIGEKAVELLTERYGSPKGKVLELQGGLAAENIRLRMQGFTDVLKNYPDIKLIQKPTEWDLGTAYNATVDTLSANPDLDLIYWHSDYIADSVMAAIDDSNRLFKRGEDGHIIICEYDGQPIGLDYIRNGYADAAVNQPLLDYGFVVRFLKRAWEGNPIKVGEKVEADAYWSPAEVTAGVNGPEVLLAPLIIDLNNLDDPTLWGNSLEWEAPAE